MLRRKFPYISILFLGLLLCGTIHVKYSSDIQSAKEAFHEEEHIKSKTLVGDIREDYFKRIYEGLRTISRLPSIKRIDRYGQTIGENDKKVIQEVYNSIANQISLSEVYILPLDFNPERKDPVTSELEKPILAFDEVIVGKTALSNKGGSGADHKVEEIEIYEYKVLQKQLKWFAEHYPSEDKIQGLDVPAVIGPKVITCDNSRYNPLKPNDEDRSGLLYSVPFFDDAHQLKGSISGIFLTSVMRDWLPSGNYAIRKAKQGLNIFKSGKTEASHSKTWIEAGRANPELIYSEVLPLGLNDKDGEWELWAGVSNQEFWQRNNVVFIQNFAKFSYSMVAVLVFLLSLAVYFFNRHGDQLMKSQQEMEYKNKQLNIAIEQIEKLRNEHALVLNSMGEGIHWLDVNGKIKYENPSAAQMLGYSATELVGKPGHLTMHHTHADGTPHDQADCPIYKSLKDGLRRRIKSDVFWRKDGTSFPVEYTCTPLLNENGAPNGCVVLFNDITEQKEAEELESVNKKLTLMYEMQKDFTSTVSHELRTPLASIKAAIDLVIKRMVGDINPDQEEVLGRAKKNVDRLKRLIDDILDLTKMEIGKLKMNFISKDLHAVIEEVVENQKDVAHTRELYVKTDLKAKNHQLAFDSDRIIQVLNNLLSNALKFTKEGGVTITTIDQPQENAILVSVQDTGKGIAKTDMTKIFQKFQQLESSQDVEEGGTGLGLAITKEIINLHGGKIWVESKLGQGTTFSFILPYKNGQ